MSSVSYYIFTFSLHGFSELRKGSLIFLNISCLFNFSFSFFHFEAMFFNHTSS